MVVDITMSQLWWNKSLMNYFFRKQSENTLNEVMEKIAVEDYEQSFEMIDEFFETLDDCEETFYEKPANDIVEMLGLPVIDE